MQPQTPTLSRRVGVLSRTGRTAVAALGMACLVSLAACGGPPSQTPTLTETPVPVITPVSSPTPTLTPPPGPGLTGGPVLAVKIDHTRASYPRAGLASADVVYVEPVEAGLTRLLAVFSSKMPPSVGPVRSSRESDVDLLANYGKVAFAFSGASDYTLGLVKKGAQVNLSFDENRTGYTRDRKRRMPYDVIGSTSVLLNRAGGSVPPGDPGFYFGAAPSNGAAGASVQTSWTSSKIIFTFDKASGQYLVSADGRPEKDALTGQPVRVANVIVQFVATHLTPNRDVNGVQTPVVDVIGNGQAIVLRDGKAWTTTWSRPGPITPTMFVTPEGQPMLLASGQTWVLLVPQGQTVTVA